jgi:hypothetical protein
MFIDSKKYDSNEKLSEVYWYAVVPGNQRVAGRF